MEIRLEGESCDHDTVLGGHAELPDARQANLQPDPPAAAGFCPRSQLRGSGAGDNQGTDNRPDEDAGFPVGHDFPRYPQFNGQFQPQEARYEPL